jgi:Fe-S cluster assembly iron-binding protein IscA
MIHVTATAFSRLKQKLRRQPEGIAVRITVEDGVVQFRPDCEQTGDVVLSHKGKSLLLVSEETAKRTANKVLDVVEIDGGQRLRFVRSA